MSVFLQPIYTQTVGVGGVATVTFNNIPQGFTDLKILMSARDTAVGTAIAASYLYILSSGSIYSTTRVYTDLSGNFSARTSNQANTYPSPVGAASLATANTFSNIEMYIPNYTSSNYKQIIVDSVTENNSSSAYAVQLSLDAQLWRTTSAITTFTISSSTLFAQYSTFSLYGITKG
jgi:hypothetical protein